MNFREWLWLESHSMTIYHGSPIAALPGILEKGVIPLGGQGWDNSAGVNYGDHFSYFSPNLERAARYAVGPKYEWTPVVIEISLSMTPKRVGRMQYDPMDREESADDYGDTGEQEEFRDLEDEVKRFINQHISGYSRRYGDGLESGAEQGLEGLNGFNLYRYILSILQSQLGQRFDRSRIMANIQDNFPPGKITNHLSITQSGTLRINQSYFASKSQIRYPKIIPPSAFKSIWVRKEDFPKLNGTEKWHVGHEMLPHEAKDWREDQENLFYKISDEVPTIEEYELKDALEIIEEWKEEIKGMDYDDDFDELYDLLDILAGALKEGKGIEEAKKDVEETFRRWRDSVYDSMDDTPPVKMQEYIKIPIQDNQIQQVVQQSQSV